jgi:predicted dehydrogenase
MPETAILVIGVGSIGERHVRCFQKTGRVRVGICEINAELRQRVARQYGIEKTYAQIEQALAEHYDAAVVATPANFHIPLAVRLAEADKHLLIEKPLSTSLEGVEQLQAATAGKNRVTAVAYVLRAHPSLGAMREAIRSGRFGRPVEVLTYCGQHFPTYRPAYREIYYKDRATGGGAVQDAITHHLNAGEWLAGPIDRLMADAAHQVLDGVEVEDTVHVITRQGRVLGSYILNQYQAPNELTITVVCTEGTARWESHNQRWRWTVRPDEPWHDEPAGKLERDDLFLGQAHAFLDAIDGLRPPLCTLEEGIQTLRVNLAVLKALDCPAWQVPDTLEKPHSPELNA